MTGPVLLTRLGFDGPVLRYAMRTALAACAALLAAWWLGLEHPQWSAMTVWAASQPTRGQLLEKSLFRVAGTLSGATVGVLLVVLSGGQPLVLVLGLAIWIALCAGIGNIQRGFVSYGTILAGYSASMVALLDSAHPAHVLALGLDRLATILVGVLTALAVGLLFTPRLAERELAGRVRRVSARVLHDLAQGLRGEGGARLTAEQHEILAEMAAIEEALEPHGAGSLRSRRSVHAVRTLLMAEMSLLLLARRTDGGAPPHGMVPALEGAAASLEAGASSAEAWTMLERLADLPGVDLALRDALSAAAAAMREPSAPDSGRSSDGEHRLPVVLHRDWDAAWRAFLRAGAAMLAVGLFWVATGWSAGPFLLLGVSIMTSLFSTFDNPARTLRFVLIGQVYGAFGALACRFLVWPLASGEWQIVLLTMPFILAAPLFFSHRRTVPSAFDYAMVSLLLLQPAYPLTGSFGDMLAGALAVIAAPLIAMAAYRLIFPIDIGRRFDMLAAAMVRELQGMARAGDAAAHRRVWRARLYHRLLRLARLADRGGVDRAAAIDGSLAVLALGSSILAMRDLLGKGALQPGTARSIRTALERLAEVAKAPDKAAAALVVAAGRLSGTNQREARTLAGAAHALAANRAFFR